MMKKVVLIIVAVLIFIPAAVAFETAGRSWNYLSLTFPINKSTSWLVLGGARHEFTRVSDDIQIATKGTYMSEFFTGPVFVRKIGPVVGVFPVFLYYMGFPLKSLDTYAQGYSLELAPTFIIKFGKLALSNRFIFHNKIYTDFYSEVMDTEDSESGYSLLLRWRIMLQYPVNSFITLEFAEEPFFGLIENDDVPPVTGPGFSEKGLDMNRLYAGISFKLYKGISLTADYVYETSYANDTNGDKELTQTAHYIFITFAAKINLFN